VRVALIKGLEEIAWYTVQMWRISQRRPYDPYMSRRLAWLRYLARQCMQRVVLKH
jgi:hypothetical protein